MTRIGQFFCLVCGEECQGRVVDGRGKYCSVDCRSIDYKDRFKGEGNPNFSNAGQKTCSQCGWKYLSYQKGSKFCSPRCYANSRPKENRRVKLVRPRRNIGPPKACKVCGLACGNTQANYCSQTCVGKGKSQGLSRTCTHCNETFNYSPSTERIFCSYECFVADGGAVRAGLASAEAILKKYGAKKDANHNEVFGVIKQFCAVHDLSNAGHGIPDGVAYVNGQWHLFDVKNPKTSYGKRGLNDRQKRWMSDWRGGPVYLIHNTDEAQRFAKGQFDGLTKQDAGEANAA